MELKLPTWEAAKELADALPGEKGGEKAEGKPAEGKGSICDVAERNKQSIRAMGGRI